MTSKNEFIERMQKFVDKQYESGKLPLLKANIVDEHGCSYEDDYYIKCLNCGRCVLVGKCCNNRLTQNMIDKERK